MTEEEKRALPIKCRDLCIHYAKCKPFTNPVGCPKIELRENVKQAIEQADYVKLASDQNLPRDFCQDVIDRIGPTREDAGSYKRAQQDMLNAGFRKVEI